LTLFVFSFFSLAYFFLNISTIQNKNCKKNPKTGKKFQKTIAKFSSSDYNVNVKFFQFYKNIKQEDEKGG